MAGGGRRVLGWMVRCCRVWVGQLVVVGVWVQPAAVVAGGAERALCAVVIVRPSWCFFLASIECMRCNKANAHRYLAFRQTGHRGEVAAYLAAVNTWPAGRQGTVGR